MTSSASSPPLRCSPLPPASHAATDDPFVVHEWGTFTTVQGADGEQIWWMPPASADLPDFVYRSRTSGQDRLGPADLQSARTSAALVRMETPVIYFYSQRERVADVRVLFRGGDPDRVVSAGDCQVDSQLDARHDGGCAHAAVPRSSGTA